MNNPDQNNKEKQAKEFPGYPAYPAKDDVTKHAESETLEEVKKSGQNIEVVDSGQQRADPLVKAKNSTDISDPSTDVTDDDIAMLSASDQGRDMNTPDLEEPLLDDTDEDGDPLNEPRGTYGNLGADLDVPGSEEDDANENIGEEDEENNYYSLGGDNHDNLEEDPSI